MWAKAPNWMGAASPFDLIIARRGSIEPTARMAAERGPFSGRILSN